MQNRASNGESEYVPGLVKFFRQTYHRGHRVAQRNATEEDGSGCKKPTFVVFDQLRSLRMELRWELPRTDNL